MEPIQDFAGLICRLRSLKERKRVVVVCPNDPHTEYVITRSLHEGFADFLLVADTPHLLCLLYTSNIPLSDWTNSHGTLWRGTYTSWI